MIPTFLFLLLLIATSAVFSGSEIAVFSISQARVRSLVDQGRSGADDLAELKANPDRLLVTILIGNNVANIATASVATWLATETFGSAGVGIATGAVTLVVLLFGEIAPKSFAAANAVQISLLAAPMLRWLSRILFFLVVPLEALTRTLVPRGARKGGAITEADIRKLTQMGHMAGVIEAHERELIERAFLLDTTQAWDVMVPRVDVFAWSDDLRLDDIADELGSVPYSRIPVYGESLDDVTGVLYVRDAYEALLGGGGARTLGSVAREPFFVPGSVSLVELLGEFQARRMHLCIVVDEYGGTDGLATLEDLLEELVGEIVDEVDVPEEMIVRVSQNEVIVDGSTDLRDINRYFGTAFLPVAEHRSLNGYLLHELGRVPEDQEVVERDDVRIEVVEATDTQVTRARLTRDPSGSGHGDRRGGRRAADA